MSQKNVEFVLEYLRLAEGDDVDVEGVATLMHPEITATAAPGWPEPGPFVGRDAALAEIKRLTDWGEVRFTDIASLTLDRALPGAHWIDPTRRCRVDHLRSQEAEWRRGQLEDLAGQDISGGQICPRTGFSSRDEALEAAGLRE